MSQKRLKHLLFNSEKYTECEVESTPLGVSRSPVAFNKKCFYGTEVYFSKLTCVQ